MAVQARPRVLRSWPGDVVPALLKASWVRMRRRLVVGTVLLLTCAMWFGLWRVTTFTWRVADELDSAVALARDGYDVALAARSVEALEKTAGRCAEAGAGSGMAAE